MTATVKIAPIARQQFFDNQGAVANGMKLFTYLAGTTTKQDTYTSSTGGTANANPVVLNSSGRTPNGLWLDETVSYKFVLAPANDTDPPSSPIWTEDNLSVTLASSDLSNTSNVAKGDALVGVKRTFSGAVASTVHLHIEGTPINVVRDAGVTGDGTTDDTTAIQAAINGGSVIYFPKPSVKYKVTAPITIASNKHIYGDGFSEIYQATTQIDTFQINDGASNIIIEGLHFSGTGSTTTGKASIHFIYTSTAITDVVIRNNKFTNPSTCGIGTDPCNRVVIAGNISNGNGDAGIYLSNCLDATVTGNVIISANSYGILLRNGSVGGGRIAISGNVIRATGNAAGAGIFCADGSYKECSITGNVIMDSVGDGINFTQGAIAGKLLITGNTITGCGNTAIQFASVTDAIISGNLIATSFLAGIYFGTSCRYNHIVGNKFFDCNTNNNAYASVYMIDTGDNVVTGNFIKTQYANTNGIRNNASANNFITGNDVSQCAIAAANRISGIVASDIVRGNKGFVTENQTLWQINSGATSVVVNHGCNRTPAAVNVTLSLRAESTNDHGYIYVDTFTATQMTVHCRNDPGASNLFGQANISIL